MTPRGGLGRARTLVLQGYRSTGLWIYMAMELEGSHIQ